MLDTLVLRAIPVRHHILAGQMLRFGVVGVFGFLVDTAIVYLLRASVGLYWAGLVSFLIAATANWGLHRVWTFRGLGTGPRHRQWAKFLAANFLGFLLNRGAYAGLVTFSALCAANPVLATGGGAVAGMAVNFLLSRHLVFR